MCLMVNFLQQNILIIIFYEEMLQVTFDRLGWRGGVFIFYLFFKKIRINLSFHAIAQTNTKEGWVILLKMPKRREDYRE